MIIQFLKDINVQNEMNTQAINREYGIVVLKYEFYEVDEMTYLGDKLQGLVRFAESTE